MSGLVVIGASYAGVQASLTARDSGYAERVTIVADENSLPYQRPPLSKGFLLGLDSDESLILRDGGFFEKKGIDLVLGTRVHEIDKRSRKLRFNGSSELAFDRLLIATGSRARQLPINGADLDGVCYLRSLHDAADLKARLHAASAIVVIGGGFIGLEVAASATKLGKKVTVLESAPRLLERAVSLVISEFLLNMHRRHGVDVLLEETAVSIEERNGRVAAVRCGNKMRVPADIVLIGVGGVPNDQLAKNADLKCTNGIVVDDHGRTSDSNIFAAGDCASHYNVFAQEWLRLESVQNAQDQAKAAGLAIAGDTGPYESVPRFWSDQYDAKLQIVGISRNFDTQVVRGSIEDGKFSVFYYRREQLIAVDSINRAGDQMAARRLIASGISPSPEEVTDLSFDFKSVLKAANSAGA
jgi:NADPH-dependent 2,4-dienoyl-CoA reductase/sulfur reductase-like enzyme